MFKHTLVVAKRLGPLVPHQLGEGSTQVHEQARQPANIFESSTPPHNRHTGRRPREEQDNSGGRALPCTACRARGRRARWSRSPPPSSPTWWPLPCPLLLGTWKPDFPRLLTLHSTAQEKASLPRVRTSSCLPDLYMPVGCGHTFPFLPFLSPRPWTI